MQNPTNFGACSAADLSDLACACIAPPLRLHTTEAVGCKLSERFRIEGANIGSTSTFQGYLLHSACAAKDSLEILNF
jgi:hypothetical protein